VRLVGAKQGDAVLQLPLSTCCLFTSVQVSLLEQVQKPVIPTSCANILQFRSWLTLLCPAEYTADHQRWSPCVIKLLHRFGRLGSSFQVCPYIRSFPDLFVCSTFLPKCLTVLNMGQLL